MPGLNLRPAITLTCGRSSQAFGPTPRSCALASVPSALVTMFTTCDSSGDTRGRPSLPRAMPARFPISGIWSRVIIEFVSDCDPPRRTIALASSPVVLSVASNPSAIASSATRTPTTPAIPTTMTAEAPQRCGRLATPICDAAIASRPWCVSASHRASPTAMASIAYQGRTAQAASPAASASTTPRLPRPFLIRSIETTPQRPASASTILRRMARRAGCAPTTIPRPIIRARPSSQVAGGTVPS